MIKEDGFSRHSRRKIEFAHAKGTTNGRINKAEESASITEQTGMGFEPHSWFTAQTGMDANGVHYGAGEDMPIQTVKDASTDGSISTANLMEKSRCALHQPDHCHWKPPRQDLTAATLRYNSVVPEDAKGKTFSITFTAVSSTGDSSVLQNP